MKESLIEKFKQLFYEYKDSEQYEFRKKQFAFVKLAREVISETLKQSSLQNEHLTGLIQMLKWECTEETFERYIKQNIPDAGKQDKLITAYKTIGKIGYTGTGLNSISGLTNEQLAQVKEFLQNAFDVITIEQAYQLCSHFESLNVPHAKAGIYSPWLYYINPKIFPISNNTHDKFRKWLGLPNEYSSFMKEFGKLNQLIGEEELGPLDDFAHRFTTDEFYFDVESFIKKLNSTFKKTWRCATSNQWENFKSRSVLSLNWLDNNTDYSNLKTFKEGKMSTTRWVNQLSEGDLIFILDKYYYYGIAVARSGYKYKGNDLEFGGRTWSCINIEFIHYLDKPVEHQMNVTHTNPATFYELNGLGFDEKSTLLFFKQSFPEAIERLSNYLNPVKKEKNTSMEFNHTLSKNTILYGPPGTGKTYHSVSHAVSIIENKKLEDVVAENRDSVKNRFEQYRKTGRIVFTTFHQSMGYEDFIEGIKPVEPNSEEEQLTYAVEDGIFKRLCTEASFSFVKNTSTVETEKVLDFSAQYDRFVDSVNEKLSNGEKTEVTTRSGGTIIIDSISQKNNIWATHLDGNRRYTVSKKRLSKLSQAFPNLAEVTNINDQFRDEIGGSNSSAYWAVLNAIRNQPPAERSSSVKPLEEKEYAYEDKKAIIETLENRDYTAENAKQYVLIIDEINRGNVSQIFGELITLIEDDKRLGKKEALKATLPYSKEEFGVPCNVHIIGTMNTADRSVEALDSALRRRFSFKEIMPKPNELKVTLDGIDLAEMLRVMNKRLTILKDSDHTIGHAWLWNINNIEQLKLVFGNKILPLLKEYFYNDYEKLGLVLGDTFFAKHEQVSDGVFASFSGGNGLAGQYDQSWQYKLKPVDELSIEDFKTLGNQLQSIESVEE